ncbi:MAG: hypothetical protein AAF203_06255, partial [Pseudomonadota bacterium]
GTDPSRSLFVSDLGREYLGNLLTGTPRLLKDRAICHPGSKSCLNSAGRPFRGVELVVDPKGYLADRLDGLWSRAPFLINGSVPTLYHLLVSEERPESFCRGDLAFDQEKVGFRWEPDDGKCPEGAKLFNTKSYGSSNRGHDGLSIGRDWSDHKTNPQLQSELFELLEYLKTL